MKKLLITLTALIALASYGGTNETQVLANDAQYPDDLNIQLI
jgi:hypothetical protein